MLPTLITYNIQYKTLVLEKEKQTLENLGSLKANEIENIIHSTFSQLQLVSKMPFVQKIVLKQQKVSDLKSYFLETNNLGLTQFSDISFYNNQAILLFSSSEKSPKNIKAEKWWEKSFNQGLGEVYFEDLGFNLEKKEHYLRIVLPLFTQNEFKGILKADINILKLLEESLYDINNENFEVLLVKSNGSSVYNKSSGMFNEKINHKLLQFLKTQNQLVKQTNILKSNYLVFSQKINFNHGLNHFEFSKNTNLKHKSMIDNNWYLLILSNEAYSLEKFTSSRDWFFTMSMVFFFLMSLFLAILIGKWVSKPLKSLLSLIQHINSGNVQKRVSIQNQDEIGQLGFELNKMLDTLQHNHFLTKEFDQALHKNKELQNSLELAQKISRMGHWQLNIQTKEALWSKEVLNIFGLNKAPISTGINFLKHHVHKEDWEQVYSHLKETMLKNEEYKGTFRIINQLGKIRFVECCAKVFENKAHVLIGTLQDISDKIQAQKELVKFKTVLEYSPVSIIITDIEGHIEYVNPCFTKTTGYELQSVMGKNPRFLKSGFTKPEKYAQLWECITSAKTWTGTFKNIRKDGSEYWESAIITPIVINGKIENFFAIKQEITQQVYLQEELKEKEKILQQQSKMAIMGEMIENIAHQWRQPLSLISTTASGLKLKQEMTVRINNEEIRYLEQIIQTSKYLSQTIDDFRNFFKPDKKAVYFDVVDSYERTKSLLSSKFKDSNIIIVEHLEPLRLMGFENEFVQVLMNLLSNAKDALIECDEPRYIFIETFETKTQKGMVIKDNAGGIDERIINKIFEPYFTTKDDAIGTGIGLYMVDEIIVKHMKGHIEVSNETFVYEDKNYKGAKFILYFKTPV